MWLSMVSRSRASQTGIPTDTSSSYTMLTSIGTFKHIFNGFGFLLSYPRVIGPKDSVCRLEGKGDPTVLAKITKGSACPAFRVKRHVFRVSSVIVS